MPAQHPISYGLLDASDEVGTMTVYTGPITVATIAAYLTQWGALKNAINALALGAPKRETLVIDSTDFAPVKPTNNMAQREFGLRVTYRGNTSGKKYSVTIPSFDGSKVNAVKDEVIITGGSATPEVLAFITAFQTLCKSPDNDAEAVTVLGMKIVGRNS
jgi:hypothetical protein